MPGTSPGVAVPRNTRWVSRPLCAEPIVGAAPKKTVRASRLVSEPLAEQRLAGVDLYRLGVRAVDVGVDDGLPRVLQVLRQLGVHGRGRRSGSSRA